MTAEQIYQTSTRRTSAAAGTYTSKNIQEVFLCLKAHLWLCSNGFATSMLLQSCNDSCTCVEAVQALCKAMYCSSSIEQKRDEFDCHKHELQSTPLCLRTLTAVATQLLLVHNSVNTHFASNSYAAGQHAEHIFYVHVHWYKFSTRTRPLKLRLELHK
jgi:hypothetical protein